ncbi:MAG: YicC/YloC family endoribonuclease, partial [Planctomycetia bacterium]|nr:YicC/YloC family endoribonuclease [Planctomycetia bacterium]
MTGFGSCTTQGDDYVISTEIKAVNNRFLKTSIKLPEGFSGLESKIDELLHEKIARGSVNFNLKVTRQSDAFDFEVNFSTLRRYISEVFRFERENQDLPSLRMQSSVTDFLRLPGVIQDKARCDDANLSDLLWNRIAENVRTSLKELQTMREVEGASTQKYLAQNISELRTMIEEVERIAPTVVENYRAKLTERVTKALEETSVDLDPSALIREVAIFTDRVDISEEIARFISHLSQFSNTMECEKVCGKKLDFLTQEMFRETNTIGS